MTREIVPKKKATKTDTRNHTGNQKELRARNRRDHLVHKLTMNKKTKGYREWDELLKDDE